MNAPHDPQHRAIHEAADWYARLRGEPSSAALEQAWQAWLAASDAHRQAWRRVEAVCGRFGRVPGALSLQTLRTADTRRTVLRSLALFAVVGASGALAYRVAPWSSWSSDYRTATGERRELQLADGSRLMLNTASAVDALFDPTQRLLRLQRGEILVTTHADPVAPSRPFRVHTAHGRILALGTRFTVRIDDDITTVSVLEKAVEVTPADSPDRPQRVEAGEQFRFGPGRTGQLMPARPDEAAWSTGRLVVVDQPLPAVLAELARYRTGHLGCAPALAGLRVSGAFPLDNTDEALSALGDSFGLRIEYRTRYWVRLIPGRG